MRNSKSSAAQCCTLAALIAAVVAVAVLATAAATATPTAPAAADEPRASLGRAPAETRVLLHLVLKHDPVTAQKLDDEFWAVSNPDSPRQGDYLTPTQLAALMQPTQATLAAVKELLAKHGVKDEAVHFTPWNDHVLVVTDAGTSEKLLHSEVHMFDKANGADISLGLAAAGVPDSHPLADALIMVNLAPVRDAEKPGNLRAALTAAADAIKVQDAAASAAASAAAAEQPESDDASSTRAYPLTFWPPAPIVSSGFGEDGLIMETILTCPDPIWPTMPYPLRPGTQPSLPAQVYPEDAYEPCGADYGRVESYTFTFTAADGSHQDVVTWDFEIATGGASEGCQSMQFGLLTCPEQCDNPSNYAPVLWNLGLCVMLLNPTLHDDVPYQVQVGIQFANQQSVLSQTYISTPAGKPLHILQTPQKTPSLVHNYYGAPEAPVGCSTKNQQAIGVLQPPSSGFYSDTDLQKFYNDVNIPTVNYELVDFVSQLASNSSLPAFLAANGLYTPAVPVTNVGTNPGGETTLDVQWISGMAPGVKTTVWHGGYFVLGNGEELDPLLAIQIAAQYATEPPMVMSMSYGGPENPNANFMDLEESLFKGMGAVGTTVLVSSGDTGAHMNDGSSASSCTNFAPSYPATSAYVTAVGATQLVSNGGVTTEQVCSIATGALITSGGGFSNMIARPDYQKATLDPVNSSGMRGYPDVALFGHQFEIVLGGSATVVDGTSASSPSFAGLVSLWNDQLLRQGKPQLGFLNPKLYALYESDPSVFNDITQGDNTCMGQSAGGVCCEKGYYAREGWDAVSGMGSPRFDKLAVALTGSSWSSGGCTVALAACHATCASTCQPDGTCGHPLPEWAIPVIIVGGIVLIIIIATICVKCCKSKPRKQPAPTMTYVAM